METLPPPPSNYSQPLGNHTDSCQDLPAIFPLDRDQINDCVFINGSLVLYRTDWATDPGFIPAVTVYALTSALGLIGNTIVILVLLSDHKRRSVTTSFLASLAIADLLYIVVCVPHELVLKLATYWVGGAALCKIAGFIEMLSAAASVLNLTAVSVERYIVIVHPMRSRLLCTRGTTKRVIVLVWAVAALLAAPMLQIMKIDVAVYYSPTDYVIGSYCVDSNVSDTERVIVAWYQLIIMFILPTLVMLYCYVLVIHVLWASTKELMRMTSFERTRKKRSGSSLRGKGKSVIRQHSTEIRETRKQVIKMLLTVIVIFLVCWGPKLVLNLIKRYEMLHVIGGSFYVTMVINLLPFIQSCSNPIIYSFMSTNFTTMRANCCRSHFKRQVSMTRTLAAADNNGRASCARSVGNGSAKNTFMTIIMSETSNSTYDDMNDCDA